MLHGHFLCAIRVTIELRLQQRASDIIAVFYAEVERGASLEGRAGVDRDSEPFEVIVETVVERTAFVAGADDQVVWPRLDVLEDFQRVRFDLVCVDDVPHVKAGREYDDRASDPVVVYQEVPVLHAVDFHLTVEVFICIRPHSVKPFLECIFIEGWVREGRGGEAPCLPEVSD